MDPEKIGVNQKVLNLLHQYPAANENAGDGSNTLGFRSPRPPTGFNTYIASLDYHITSNGSETFRPRSAQNFKEPGQPQLPGRPPN